MIKWEENWFLSVHVQNVSIHEQEDSKLLKAIKYKQAFVLTLVTVSLLVSLWFADGFSIQLVLAEWWSTYGGSCPNLARLATRIQSQTCSSLADTRNQIPFERIYDTRNCLERQRLIDLVFVQYNLRLKHM